MKIIIMAGGSGTRLWPLSRKLFPKQFLKFKNFYEKPKSLFQEAFQRAMKFSSQKDIFIVTNMDQKFLVMGEIEELGIKFCEDNILIEPEAKGTLPAVLLGVRECEENESFLVLTSDHHIKKDENLVIRKEEVEKLTKNSILLVGIKPNSPQTGYGYIKSDNMNNILEFREKPGIEVAKELIANGYVWNSGMLASSRDFFESQVREFCSEYLEILSTQDIIKTYKNLHEVSFDYAILEKSKDLKLLTCEILWSDLGSFDSIYDNSRKDNFGNVMNEDCIVFDSHNNLIQSFEGKKVAVSGIKDTIVIDTKDALLICKKNTSQNVKEIVNKLKEEKHETLEVHKKAYRPWGSYIVLEDEPNYKVKRLTIYPNRKLSLQLHNKRSEHWVVTKGTATVVKGEKEFDLKESESIFIPVETKHRISNKSDSNVEIIEVQTGSYFGEDDIIRFEDDFGRE